jgi:CHAT domain/Tetratricopeptide repeat
MGHAILMSGQEAQATVDDLRRRIRHFTKHRNAAGVLDPVSLDLARRIMGWIADEASRPKELSGTLPGEAIRCVAWLHWCRYQALPAQKREAELQLAAGLFVVIHHSDPSLVPKPLRPAIISAAAPLAAGDLQPAVIYGTALLSQASRSSDEDVLNSAIILLRHVTRGMSPGSPLRAGPLSNLSVALRMRFERAGNQADLDDAVTAGQDAVAAAPALGPDRPGCLSNLSAALQARFGCSRDIGDLDGAIGAAQEAVAGTPAGHPGRAAFLFNLSAALQSRFEQTADLVDLDKAIRGVRDVLIALPAGHPDRLACMSGLSAALQARHERTGDAGNLDEAVSAGQAAADGIPPGHPDRARCLANLSAALYTRFQHAGDPADLDNAIIAGRETGAATPAGGYTRAGSLSNLAMALQSRFERTADLADLDDAITTVRQALAAAPPGHPSQAGIKSNLSIALKARFGETGNLADLNHAITAARDAAAATPAGDPNHAAHLSNLGLALRTRFERTGNLADLDDAITTGRSALAAIALDHASRAAVLSGLTTELLARFRRTGDESDLNEAVAAGREAAAATGPGHPGRPGCLANLSATLQSRFGRAANPSDLDEAISACRDALAATPPGHLSRAGYLSNLGVALRTRFELTAAPADLDEAIRVGSSAVASVPPGHPGRADYLFNLGHALRARYAATGDSSVRDAALAAGRQAADIRAAPASRRIAAAGQWGQWAAADGLAAEAEAAFAAAVEILPLLAWHGLDRATREQQLAEWPGLAADAAAWAITAGHPERAVELLEQGRTILWSHMLQLRSDLDELRSSDPDLADRLNVIRAELDSPADDPPGADIAAAAGAAGSAADARRRQGEARMRRADEWDQLLAGIRARPGFGAFLAIPPFADLAHAPENGTVVIINVSRYRCDALAITLAGVTVIPLPDLTAAGAARHAEAFLRTIDELGGTAVIAGGQPGADGDPDEVIRRVLDWLWDSVARPILHDLGMMGPAPCASEPGPAARGMPRLWWCPTGPLSVLPLHAAGHHDPAIPGSCVLDHVISSYTPTLRALHRARTRRRTVGSDEGRMLLVTMPTTHYLPGGAPLPGVAAEAVIVARRFATTHYTGRNATIDRVLAGLPAVRYAHFACHGGINADQPADSGLCLEDGILTIGHLAQHDLPAAELAFLSACQTAAGSIRHLDEALTMAAAMHLAGFRQVIATLWTVADMTAPAVAEDVYDALTTAERPAFAEAAVALHRATGRLRAAGQSPASWASYIHTGP